MKYLFDTHVFLWCCEGSDKLSNTAMKIINDAYTQKYIDLPFIHRDPYDRLLIATARADGMTILTADENIHKYDVPFVW